MRRLLIPLDGSPASMRALEYAIGLAGEFSAAAPLHLHLVSVHEVPLHYGRSLAYFTAEQLAQMEAQHSAAVLQPAGDRLQALGISFSTESAAGEVAQAIVESAERNACDVIVMGTRGMGSIGSLMVGSVATKVVHLATTPVMLVK
jgi:nucleotide-binding universal stress UspA family protein